MRRVLEGAEGVERPGREERSRERLGERRRLRGGIGEVIVRVAVAMFGVEVKVMWEVGGCRLMWSGELAVGSELRALFLAAFDRLIFTSSSCL